MVSALSEATGGPIVHVGNTRTQRHSPGSDSIERFGVRTFTTPPVVLFAEWTVPGRPQERTMPKIECENCGRKATVGKEDRESRAPMRYCRRCGDELPSHEE